MVYHLFGKQQEIIYYITVEYKARYCEMLLSLVLLFRLLNNDDYLHLNGTLLNFDAVDS